MIGDQFYACIGDILKCEIETPQIDSMRYSRFRYLLLDHLRLRQIQIDPLYFRTKLLFPANFSMKWYLWGVGGEDSRGCVGGSYDALGSPSIFSEPFVLLSDEILNDLANFRIILFTGVVQRRLSFMARHKRICAMIEEISRHLWMAVIRRS